jgi:hypothetical protein
MKFIVLLLLLGILLNSAYAVDSLYGDMNHVDVSHEAEEVHSDRFSVLVNTAMELMEPEAQETASQQQITAQASN